jgi:TonB-linked SusC/RagA family outer membrane protein
VLETLPANAGPNLRDKRKKSSDRHYSIKPTLNKSMNFYTLPGLPRINRRQLIKIFMIMKITMLLIIFICLRASASTYAQNISLSEKNVTVEKVIGKIKQQSTYVFWYESKLLKDAHPVTITVQNGTIQQTLDLLLKDQPLVYQIVDNTIVISEKPAPSAQPQPPRNITGKVTDDKGLPLPGVNVMIKGTQKGTITNNDGNYSLTVEPNQVIVFTFIGFKKKEIFVNEQKEINVGLELDQSQLNNVVVVGYGTQKKVNLTGAVSTVSGSVLEDRPITNIGRGLQGELPGLNVTSSSGQPGAAPTFNIRGFTSINGGEPLVLVDGVETNIDDLNPDDVATATILKDAASAAVYGSRAAFGVLLITTKNGQKGAPKVSYSMNYAIHKITDLPDVVTDPGTVTDYKNQAYAGYYGVNLYNTAQTAYAHQRSADPSLPTTVVDPTNPNVYDYYGATNWFKELYNPTNTSQTQNVNVSGGNDKITYYFSADYNNQTGVFRYNPDYYERFNIRGKLDFKITDWLHIYTNSAYNRTIYNSPSLWTSDWTSGDLYHQIGRLNSLTVLKNPDGSWTSSGAYIGFLQQGGRDNTVTNEPQNTIGFTTSFFNDTWRIKGDYTFRATNNYDQSYQVAIPYETGPNQQVSYAGHSDASAWADDNSYQAINLYTEYEKTFGKHYLKGMVGFNQELNKYNYFSASNDNLISSSVGYLDETTSTTPSVAGNGYQWAVRGIFSRLNYIYDNKYLLELDARYDGSSRFPTNQHYAFLPSASAGWRVSQEPFFKALTKVVTNLKLRASYGVLGNDQSLGNYSFIPTLSSGTASNILGGTQPVAVYPPNLVSPTLTWEKVYNMDGGIDFTLFNKLSTTFDWYQRDTKNMITKGFQLPAVLGATQPLENAADSRTQGWELNITYNDQFQLAGKPFNFGLRGSVWDSQTVITKYNNPNKFWFGGDYYVGEHPGDIWGLTTKGIFQTDAAAKAAPDQSKVQGYYSWNKAGEIQYVDRNGDGKIDYGDGTVGNPGDAHVIGNTSPRYNFGAGGNFTWNNFDFSIFFQGVGKETFWPGTSGYYWGSFFSPWDNVYKNIVGNTWTPQNPNAFYPSLKGWRAGDDGAWVDLAVPQTRYLYSAAYIRLKNLIAGYSFNVPFLKKIGVERLRFYFSGEDLWESDHLPQGFDPEALGGTWGAGKVYPFQRGYSFGLNAKF